MKKVKSLIAIFLKSPRVTIILMLSLLYLVKIVVFDETSPNRFWNKGDAIFYHFIGTSLIEDGDFDLSNNRRGLPLEEGHFALSKYGYPTAKQSPLMTIVSLPLRLIFGPVGTLWFNLICSLGIVLILYELLTRWVTSFSALVGCLLVGVASVLFRYAFNFSPDVFSCLLLLGLLLSTLKQKWIFVGVLAGLAVSAKIGNIIVVIPVLGYALSQLFLKKEFLKNMKTYSQIAISFFFAILPFLVYNNYLFGSPFTTGYQAILIMNEQGAAILSHTNDFNLPFVKGLVSLLFNKHNGLVTDNWLVVSLGLIGMFFYSDKNRKEMVLLLTIVIVQVVFYAFYDHQLASRLGNRFLLVSISLMAVPTSFLIEKIKKAF